MPARVGRTLTDFRPWLGLATLLFTGWYATFLFRFRLVEGLVAGATVAHETLPLVPAVGRQTIGLVVGTVAGLGLPATIVTLFVGFACFHWQAEAARP